VKFLHSAAPRLLLAILTLCESGVLFDVESFFLNFWLSYRTLYDVDIFQVYSLAGLCSGLTEGLAVTPFERVKVQLQSEKDVRLKDVSNQCFLGVLEIPKQSDTFFPTVTQNTVEPLCITTKIHLNIAL